METRKLYINGSWIVAESDRVIKVENPETHAIIACVPRSGDADVNKAVAAAKAAFETWQFAPLSERLEKMERVLAGMRRNRQRLIDTISAELGCPIKIAAEMHTDPFILETENYIETARSFCYEERRGTSVVRTSRLSRSKRRSFPHCWPAAASFSSPANTRRSRRISLPS